VIQDIHMEDGSISDKFYRFISVAVVVFLTVEKFAHGISQIALICTKLLEKLLTPYVSCTD
jgi:hypothetical protein